MEIDDNLVYKFHVISKAAVVTNDDQLQLPVKEPPQQMLFTTLAISVSVKNSHVLYSVCPS